MRPARRHYSLSLSAGADRGGWIREGPILLKRQRTLGGQVRYAPFRFGPFCWAGSAR